MVAESKLTDARKFKRIRVADLIVDDRVQRSINTAVVDQMVIEGVDFSKLEVITVAYRDGNYHVVEGQHRAVMLRLIDPEFLAMCAVLADTTKEDEAEIAMGINDSRRRQTAFDKWNLRLHAKREHEIEALKVLNNFDMSPSAGGSGSTVIGAGQVLRLIHSKADAAEGAEHLRKVLNVLTGAYPNTNEYSLAYRFHRFLVSAVHSLLITNPDLKVERLAEVIAGQPALHWVNLGYGAPIGSPSTYICQMIVPVYNKYQRGDNRIRLRGDRDD